MNEGPQFNIASAFDFLKEKEGKDYPSLYKLLYKQEEFTVGDCCTLKFDDLFYTDDNLVIPKKILTSSPYVRKVEPRLKGLHGSSYEFTIKDVKRLEGHLTFSWIDLVIDLPDLRHLGYVSAFFGHEILDLSKCKRLESISFIGSGIHIVRFSKKCPFAKNEMRLRTCIHSLVKIELI